MSNICKVITTTYKTTDGRVFESFKKAEEHQAVIESLVWFHIRYAPDLTEGRRAWTKEGYVVVNANKDHDLFAVHACHEVFGSPVAFVQGVFGSNAIIDNWQLAAERIDMVEPGLPVVISVEERFVKTKIFGEGIHTE